MILSTVNLKGFRNFKKSKINFNNKSLIIGANDVGKTNLLWALRLLLDRGLSDYDLEPQDSDFYAYEETNSFTILLCFKHVTDDCVVAKMKGKISDTGDMFLAYKGFRDESTKAKSYKLFAGPEIKKLEEIEDRYYRKVLNLKYISSRRDFHNYINREKNYLFQLAKDNRDETQLDEDNKLYSEIQDDLKIVDDKVPNLNFVANATTKINEELSKLSLHHTKQKVVFDSSTSNVDSFIKNVSISSKSNDKNVLIGGDGRLNQIYLALWASRNQLTEDSFNEVTIFCIEEPEAHLHPHQQRKLAEYLNKLLKGQVLITSHSPQIAAEFSPNSIVRIYNNEGESIAASNGCSQIIDDSFKDFGYRMSIIPAEAFFSNVVFLVEGPSEGTFYKTLSKELDIDLDRLNISVLLVDGIGFETYIKILNSLEIEWVLRTDNDIFKIPKKNQFRYAGIQRCLKIYKDYFESNAETEKVLLENESYLKWSENKEPPENNLTASKLIIEELAAYNLHLSEKDLENDLFNSPIKEDLEDYFSDYDEDEIIKLMQSHKATFMFSFLRENRDKLVKLKDDDLSKPLFSCIEIVKANESY